MDTDTQPVPAVTVEQASDAGKTPVELFRYTASVNVGAGADTCDVVGCTHPEHFHAWVRLPNQFQHSDIRMRAQAAKARRMRQLRDRDSDSYAILEADLAELERAGDRAAIVDELVNKDWWRDHLEALREIEDGDDYTHIQADRDRLQQIDALPHEKRPHEERDELLRHFEAYNRAVEARRDELQAPRRQALEGLTSEQLIEQIREERVEAEATAAFMETYSKWEWFAGTLVPVATGRPRDRLYQTIEQLEDESPEILDALREAFTDLERSLQRGPTGNS